MDEQEQESREPRTDEAARIGEDFRRRLNGQGHSFQRRVWRAFHDLADPEGGAPWKRESYDFPVQLNGESTSIDMIVRHSPTPIFLAVECKRANPGVARWCFARGPQGERDLLYPVVLVEGQQGAVIEQRRSSYSKRVFGHALDLRSSKPGESDSPGRGAIETAVTQVLRGLGGLQSFGGPYLFKAWTASSGNQAAPREGVLVFPVVVTTATLWATEADIESASLEAGELAPGSVEVQPYPWLFLRYNITPALRPASVGIAAPPTPTLAKMRERDYGRTVAIVNADGLAQFLGEFLKEID